MSCHITSNCTIKHELHRQTQYRNNILYKRDIILSVSPEGDGDELLTLEDLSILRIFLLRRKGSLTRKNNFVRTTRDNSMIFCLVSFSLTTERTNLDGDRTRSDILKTKHTLY